MLAHHILILVIMLGWVNSLPAAIDWIPENDYFMPGDLNIGVLGGGSYSHCKYPSKSRLQGLKALVKKIKDINKDPDFLPNINIGLAWLNNCWEPDVTLLKGLRFLPQSNCSRGCCETGVDGSWDPDQRGCYEVVGFISPWADDQVKAISTLAGLYKIPHISLGATNDDLSNRLVYPYFMRINPPDSLLIRAIIDTIVHYNWTYVSVIGDYTQSSRNIVGFFKKEVKHLGICIAFFDEIAADFEDEDHELLVRRMATYKKAKIVVLLANTIPSGYFLKALTDLGLNRDFIIISTDRYAMERRGETFVNSLGVGYSLKGDSKKEDTFKDFYKNSSPWNYLSDPFAEVPKVSELDCSLEVEEGHNESCFMQYKTWADIPGHFLYGHYATFMDGIDIFTIGLQNYISMYCPQAFNDKTLLQPCMDGEKFLKVLYNVTFDGLSGLIKFDSNGDGIIDYVLKQVQYVSEESRDIQSVVIGEWTYNDQSLTIFTDKVKWEDHDENDEKRVVMDTPESVCAKPCQPGEFYIQGELKCCWDCRRCRDNEIIRNDSLGCEICPLLTWPEQVNFTQCELISPTYMLWNDPIAVAIEVISLLGLISCFSMSYILVNFRGHKVVKGSSVEQMSMILMAVYLCYVTTILLIVKPDFYLCYVEYCTYHLSCSFIFVPLFLKTSRLYRIFKAAERCQQEISFVSTKALLVFSFALISGQVAALCVSMVLFPIGVTRQMPITTEPFVELVCINQLENLLIPLSYNLAILLMCLLFGFLTRKLPDNFNESWYIFLSVATTLFIWVAFLPTYFMAFYAYHKGALLALALILNAVVTSVCLFGPKIYAVYFIPESEIKTSNFDASSRSTGVSNVTSQKKM